MKLYAWTTGPSEEPGKISAVLPKKMPLFPGHILRETIQKRDVKINGHRATAESIVFPGDTVQVFSSFDVELPVVFENEDILIINKPAGLCVSDDHCGMTVESMLLNQAKNEYTPFVCHRLDTNTSGLIAIAKTDYAKNALLNAFKTRKTEKIYECLVRGEMRPPQATKKAYLIKDASAGKVKILSHAVPDSREIITAYSLLNYQDGVSRLSVRLITGRTHQIRAHMAYLAHPIIGDDLYGDRKLNRKLKDTSLKLCAVSLAFTDLPGRLSELNQKAFTVRPPF